MSYLCTHCQSANIFKNGHSKSGNAQFRYKNCGRSSVLKPKIKYTEEQK
ncbi:transposase-like zinc-binding domain-containing protein [Acinetobacter sp. ANC 3832]